MYIMVIIRFNLIYLVSKLSKFRANPLKLYLLVIKWIFYYIKVIILIYLLFNGNNTTSLYRFLDTKFRKNTSNNKFIKYFVFIFIEVVIS